MPDLERWEEALLTTLAQEVRYPPTPDLGARVVARLEEGPSDKRRPLLATAALAAVGAAILLLVLTVVVSKEVQDAVAEFLGVAVPGEEIAILPTPAPGTTPTPFPAPQDLQSYATPVSQAEAANKLGFEPVLIPGRAAPAGVYIAEFAEFPVLVLDYEGFDLWQTDDVIFQKFVFSKGVSVLEEVTVNGRPAYWIGGSAHIVQVLGPDGRVVPGSQRTVTGNTLVWQGAVLNYRLEVEGMTKEEALKLAESLP
jgi:hypothetical protein